MILSWSIARHRTFILQVIIWYKSLYFIYAGQAYPLPQQQSTLILAVVSSFVIICTKDVVRHKALCMCHAYLYIICSYKCDWICKPTIGMRKILMSKILNNLLQDNSHTKFATIAEWNLW